jgi:hypothetical protein
MGADTLPLRRTSAAVLVLLPVWTSGPHCPGLFGLSGTRAAQTHAGVPPVLPLRVYAHTRGRICASG